MPTLAFICLFLVQKCLLNNIKSFKNSIIFAFSFLREDSLVLLRSQRLLICFEIILTLNLLIKHFGYEICHKKALKMVYKLFETLEKNKSLRFETNTTYNESNVQSYLSNVMPFQRITLGYY